MSLGVFLILSVVQSDGHFLYPRAGRGLLAHAYLVSHIGGWINKLRCIFTRFGDTLSLLRCFGLCRCCWSVLQYGVHGCLDSNSIVTFPSQMWDDKGVAEQASLLSLWPLLECCPCTVSLNISDCSIAYAEAGGVYCDYHFTCYVHLSPWNSSSALTLRLPWEKESLWNVHMSWAKLQSDLVAQPLIRVLGRPRQEEQI